MTRKEIYTIIEKDDASYLDELRNIKEKEQKETDADL